MNERSVSHAARALQIAFAQAPPGFRQRFTIPEGIYRVRDCLHVVSSTITREDNVQSLCRPERLKRFPAGYYTDIVIDEAHHSLSNSYRDIIDHFDTSRILGVTATPDRGDHRALSEVYESLAYEYPMRKAIREGYLVPIRAKMLPVEVDLTEVRTSCGDYSANSLGDAIEPYLDEIAGRMAEECKVRKTVVFLPLIRMAKRFAELLNAHGISAAEVNGDSPDREEILADFEERQQP